MANIPATVVITRAMKIVNTWILKISGKDFIEDYLTPQQKSK